MRLLRLHLLLGIMRYSMHDADQAFVAALEDAGYGTSSPDASLFALDSDHPEESTLLFDTTLSGDDLENIFTDAPLPDYTTPPPLLSFNVDPPPNGFDPCPKGLRYACCSDSTVYEAYPLKCIWYDYDFWSPVLKKALCRGENIHCCRGIENDGYQEQGGSGLEGFDCEPATRSAFMVPALPAPAGQSDDGDAWAGVLLRLLLFKHPLFQIPVTPPGDAPE